MMRELEPGLIVSAVVCLILFLDFNFDVGMGRELFQYKVFRELYPWLILSAVAFWSLFVHKYWGIFVIVSFLILLIIEKYEPEPSKCVYICGKNSQWALFIGIMGVAGINTLGTLYIMIQYYNSS
jgi:hypothetical protein